MECEAKGRGDRHGKEAARVVSLRCRGQRAEQQSRAMQSSAEQSKGELGICGDGAGLAPVQGSARCWLLLLLLPPPRHAQGRRAGSQSCGMGRC